MYQSSLCRLLLAALLLVLSWSTAVFAAATVAVIPSGGSTYSVQGTDMNGVSGIQLDIAYDSASLMTPTVTQAPGGLASGAMFAANSSIPGHIKIAIISSNSFSGSGAIATIAFASTTGKGGALSITSQQLIDSSGSPVGSVTSTTSNDATGGTSQSPGSTSNQPAQLTGNSATTTTTTTAGAGTTTTPTYLGTVSLPSEQQQRTDASPPAPAPAVPLHNEQPAPAMIAEQPQPSEKPAAEVKPAETAQYVVYKGIVDRFRLYAGSKSLAAIASLFDKKVTQSIYQEPEILLSDGKSKATLTVDIPSRIVSSPNFAVNGGTLVSFKQDKQMKGRWVIEVLPKAATVKATVTIIAGAEEFEFPLTVAPPITTALPLDERGWNRFLTETGTTSAPLHDFNNDGIRNYIDEYIFMANYLAGRKASAKPAVPLKKPTR